MRALANRFLPVLDPRFVKIAVRDGEVVGLISRCPISPRDSGGPTAGFSLSGSSKCFGPNTGPGSSTAWSAGSEDLRGQGIDAMIGSATMAAAIEAGFRFVDSHHELEDPKVRSEMEKLGGIVLGGLRIYGKHLSVGQAAEKEEPSWVSIAAGFIAPWSVTDNPGGWVDVTDVCRLNCAHCFRRRIEGHRPLAAVLSDIDACRSMRNCDDMKISGGEPLTYPHLPDVVRHMARKGMKPFLMTSGLGLDRPLVKELARGGWSDSISIWTDTQDRPSWRARSEVDLNELRQILCGSCRFCLGCRVQLRVDGLPVQSGRRPGHRSLSRQHPGGPAYDLHRVAGPGDR